MMLNAEQPRTHDVRQPKRNAERNVHTKPIEHFRWTEICFGNNSWWNDFGFPFHWIPLAGIFFALLLNSEHFRISPSILLLLLQFDLIQCGDPVARSNSEGRTKYATKNINGNRVVYHQFRWKNSIQLTKCRCLFVRIFFFIPIFFSVFINLICLLWRSVCSRHTICITSFDSDDSLYLNRIYSKR